VQRAIYMLGLVKGEMLEALTNENILAFLYKYKYRLQTIKDLNYTLYYGNEAFSILFLVGQDFDNLSISFFKEQLHKQSQGSVERLLSLAYSVNPDTVLSEVGKPEYQATRLYSKYKDVVNMEKKQTKANLAWLTGV
jgi:hypothetical protein